MLGDSTVEASMPGADLGRLGITALSTCLIDRLDQFSLTVLPKRVTPIPADTFTFSAEHKVTKWLSVKDDIQFEVSLRRNAPPASPFPSAESSEVRHRSRLKSDED